MGFQDYGTKYGLSMDAQNRFYTDIVPVDSLFNTDPLKILSAKQGYRLYKMSESRYVNDIDFIDYNKAVTDETSMSVWEHRCICHGQLRILEGLVRLRQANTSHTWYTVGTVRNGYRPIVEERTFGTLMAVNWTNWGINPGNSTEHAEVVLTVGGELKFNYGARTDGGGCGVYYKLPYVANVEM